MVTELEFGTGTASATVCPFCGAGCGMLLEDGVAYPLLRDPVARGALCLRGWSTGELADSPLRVTRSRVRSRGDPGTPTDTEPAVLRVADQLRAIRDRHGPESIGILGSARLTYEETRLLRALARSIGTPHLDSLQRLGCTGATPLDLAAVAEAPRLVIVGVELAARHAQVGRRVLEAHARGATVKVVSSRVPQLAPLLDGHERCRPGREVETAAALADAGLVLWSSEVALAGQGAAAQRAFGARGAFLADYADQRSLLEAGVVPQPGGLSAYEMLERAAAGWLRALLIFADDPFEWFPALASRAFAALDLVMVVDAVRTRTAEAAHVLLPGALLHEKEGTIVSGDGRARAVEPRHRPPGSLAEGGVARWLIELLDGDEDPGRPEPFVPAAGALAPDDPTPDYPLVAALDASTFWGGHALVRATITAWREARGSFADFPDGVVGLAPADAKAAGVRTGARVRLESDSGEVALAARVDPRVLEGTVAVPLRCWEQAGGALGALALDPALRIPVFRPRAVRVARV
jgi:predicted molibdopterin-dependent oxidoreductase YjgC